MTGFTKYVFGFLAVLFSVSCQKTDSAKIRGSIDYIGSSTMYIEKQPLHYKYAQKRRYPIEPDIRGQFSASLPSDSREVAFFTIDDDRYPLVIAPGENITVKITRAVFPDSVHVEGYPEPWNRHFLTYWDEISRINAKIDEQMDAFREGEPTSVLDLYKHRYKIAKRHLADTPLDIYYYKNIGEYLVKRLEEIRYRQNKPGFNTVKERQSVIDKAKKLNFFSYKSLKAQRAGIRDFTNAYANTFGVEDSLEEEYGQDLMQYDIKRLGYKTLNRARTSVLDHIEERRALAYAKMHLIAERIGEMSPDVAEESYRNFLEDYRDFPNYIRFLKTFYQKTKQVTPGNPAVPFILPNQYGKMVSMEDFKGKYVLLDFWASWCIPCLDEFQHMRELYNEYSRDEFEIAAISIEKDSLRWRQAVNRFKNPWPQLYGGNSFQQETFSSYQGGGIPFYILVNPKGNIERYNDVRPSFNLPAILDSLITDEG